MEMTDAVIASEILGHLRIAAEAPRIMETSVCIPCMMPFITSQFLKRRKGDRPQVVPQGSTNLTLMGQFCELPGDVVFTVEYSMRSAQSAVCTLLRLKPEQPAVYKGSFDPRVLFKGFVALHELAS